MTADFRVYSVTWNMGDAGPPKDFTRLLGLDAKVLPDLYVIGLQEVKSNTTALISDSVYDDPWTVSLTNCLHKKNFVRIKTIKLVGIYLVVFVKRKHLGIISNVESEYTRTGFGGLWGNKGSVSIRMDISGTNICFVNSHFTAHLPRVAERIDDYDLAVDGQRFRDPDVHTILDHDYIFWIGDLNFRLDDIPNADVKKKVSEGELQSLLQYDQLKKLLKDDIILVGFQEGALTFPPTYKYDQGTDTYDTSKKQRKPGWCDRVLWLVDPNAFQGVKLGVDQLSYTSLQEYNDSDHKPVISEFIIQVLLYPAELPVLFEPLDVWCVNKSKKCVYTVSWNLAVSSWDWIGLYKADFKHWYDYETYVWASTNGEDMKDKTFLYNIQFDKDFLKKLQPGQYCLCYFSSAKNSMVGYSGTFKLSLTEDQSDSSSAGESDSDDDDSDAALELLDKGPQSAAHRVRPQTARPRTRQARADLDM